MPPRFPGLSQAPPLPNNKQYVQPALPSSQVDKLSTKATFDLPEIPLLKGQEDFAPWLYFVQAALDYEDLTQLINPNLARPGPAEAGYKNWHRQAMRVSSWLRLHVSESVARTMLLVHKPNMYPDELICTLSQFLYGTLPNLLGNQVYETSRRADYYTRSQYIMNLWTMKGYSVIQKVPVDMFQMAMTMLNALESEIPVTVAAQRQVLAPFAERGIDETTLNPLLDTLLSATE